ncbi:hypothetical protein OUZ56_024396 [Daphnia magna]|uniref:Uncharacterized protein n=1 Tax=Daphnia magna TaxID=35525 RepID=A0ABR0B0R6_9CRUS|nr:hypothetical protein OUZ56_024396 [Daphnia magna]
MSLSIPTNESSTPWTTLRYVRQGINSHDGIKRCPESALDESPSGELPELSSRSWAPLEEFPGFPRDLQTLLQFLLMVQHLLG